MKTNLIKKETHRIECVYVWSDNHESIAITIWLTQKSDKEALGHFKEVIEKAEKSIKGPYFLELRTGDDQLLHCSQKLSFKAYKKAITMILDKCDKKVKEKLALLKNGSK